jgi:hypothetical protein
MADERFQALPLLGLETNRTRHIRRAAPTRLLASVLPARWEAHSRGSARPNAERRQLRLYLVTLLTSALCSKLTNKATTQIMSIGNSENSAQCER